MIRGRTLSLFASLLRSEQSLVYAPTPRDCRLAASVTVGSGKIIYQHEHAGSAGDPPRRRTPRRSIERPGWRSSSRTRDRSQAVPQRGGRQLVTLGVRLQKAEMRRAGRDTTASPKPTTAPASSNGHGLAHLLVRPRAAVPRRCSSSTGLPPPPLTSCSRMVPTCCSACRCSTAAGQRETGFLAGEEGLATTRPSWSTPGSRRSMPWTSWRSCLAPRDRPSASAWCRSAVARRPSSTIDRSPAAADVCRAWYRRWSRWAAGDGRRG